MKPSIMTKKQPRYLVLIFCLTLLVTIACESTDVPATENSSSSKQVDEKVSAKKDAASIDSTKPSQVVVTVNDAKLMTG
jgi:adenosyl cobinamide kinase/adenosyl cobinamide phosphate guanylyltransferase